MRYEWLANHLVRRRFPHLNKKMQNEIVTEAVCRAWCTFSAPDYRMMQACINAAAKGKGLSTPTTSQPPYGYPCQDKTHS